MVIGVFKRNGKTRRRYSQFDKFHLNSDKKFIKNIPILAVIARQRVFSFCNILHDQGAWYNFFQWCYDLKDFLHFFGITKLYLHDVGPKIKLRKTNAVKPKSLLVKNMQLNHLFQFTLIKEIPFFLVSCKSLPEKLISQAPSEQQSPDVHLT